eukprot:Skav225073  [mRNA]  locus=scaffold6117:3228:14281:+ [translate_table: standard]
MPAEWHPPFFQPLGAPLGAPPGPSLAPVGFHGMARGPGPGLNLLAGPEGLAAQPEDMRSITAFARAVHLHNARSSRGRRHQGKRWQGERDQGSLGSTSICGQRHVGVICDGCRERDFVGTRYRCMTCHDYDLCSSCHSRRLDLHPSDHHFEAIHTPRLPLPAAIAELMSSAAARTVYAILEVGFDAAEDQEMYSGLDDGKISWWLSDERRLVSVDAVAAKESPLRGA